MRAGRLAIVALLLAVMAVAAVLGQRSRFAREAYVPGDRVRVAASSPTAAGATGRITLPPLPVTGDESDWHGHVRRTPGAEARFWVTLDRPLPRAGTPPLRGLELPASAIAPR